MNQNNNNERPVIDKRSQTGLTPMDNAKACGLRMMTMKEVLQHILKNAQQAHNTLKTTNSQDDIHIVLDKIHGYQVDYRVSERIKAFIGDLRGSASACQQHNFTRTQMCEMLQRLIGMLNEEIAQEEHNERVHRVRIFFTVLAEHAEDVTAWCEQSGVSLF